jgi:L-cysteine S-thiosulfotransferase
MRTIIIGAALALGIVGGAAAQDNKAAVSPDVLEKAVSQSWPKLPPELQARLEQDATARDCTTYHNNPPPKVAEAIMAREKASIVYPADGKFMGDWKAGEKGALSGYGFRMGDNPKIAAGGNCYACHQMTRAEISFGTLGPSLLGYGKAQGNTAATQKEIYEKIADSQAVLACSNMPRFGHNKVLTPEQIKDYVAYLLDPDSPVNK